jgi:hypothetical protein
MVSSAHAQWLNYPAPGIPRTKDGKPNVSAAVPRAADGRPDLSGVWTTDSTPLAEMERLFPDLGAFVCQAMTRASLRSTSSTYSRICGVRMYRSGPRPPGS